MKKLKILKFDSITSTQKYAKNLLNKSIITDNILILAYEQTEGYGRFNRKWASLKFNGIYFSLIIKKTQLVEPLPVYISLIIVKTLNEIFKINFSIKWPNDIFYKDFKIGGIIIDNISNNTDFCIIGCGINLYLNDYLIKNIHQKILSINDIKPFKIKNWDNFIKNICSKIYENLIEYKNKYLDVKILNKEYKKISTLLGLKVSINFSDNEKITGVVTDINTLGNLILNDNKIITTCQKLNIL